MVAPSYGGPSHIPTVCWASGHTNTQQVAGSADDLHYLLTKYAIVQFANKFKYVVRCHILLTLSQHLVQKDSVPHHPPNVMAKNSADPTPKP